MSAHRLLIGLGLAVAALSVPAVAGASASRGAGSAPLPAPPAVRSDLAEGASGLPGDAVPFESLAAPPSADEAAGTEAAVALQPSGGPQLRYYAVDALGSVRVVFDSTGAVIGRADYEPFGAPVQATTTGTLPREQFTGHQRDSETGVDYFGARLYLPQHGRMPSVDPLYTGATRNPQRWNRYAYALNSPAVMVDPDGRTTTCTGTSRTPGSELGSCSDGGGKGGRPSSPPSGPAFSFGVSTFDFMGFSSNEAYYLSQYGYIPEFGSQTVGFPESGPAMPPGQDPTGESPEGEPETEDPIANPDPQDEPDPPTCYGTWRFTSLFNSSPGAKAAVEMLDAVSTLSFSADVYATYLKQSARNVGLGPRMNPTGSGVNLMLRVLAPSVASKSMRAFVGGAVTPTLAVTFTFTAAYDATVAIQCAAGWLR